MRALTVRPGTPGSVALEDVGEPVPGPDEVLLRTRTIGICGTDQEIVAGHGGRAPEGEARLILGHECLAEVVRAPSGTGLAPGDWVVPMVRRPCPRAECLACRSGRSDLCWTGDYRERGILGLDGFASERFVERSAYLIPVPTDPAAVGSLLEPASVVAKAVDLLQGLEGVRGPVPPGGALVLGAGPIGLLAVLMLRLLGVPTVVYDRGPEDGPKARWARARGAAYLRASGDLLADLGDRRFLWVLECTGAKGLILSSALALAPLGAVCLLGTSPAAEAEPVPVDRINQHLVLCNGVLFGSVNASRHHFLLARAWLTEAAAIWPGCLEELITDRLAVAEALTAFPHRPGEIKTLIDWTR